MCMSNSLLETLFTQYVLPRSSSSIGITWELFRSVESEALSYRKQNLHFNKILRGNVYTFLSVRSTA